MDEGYKERYRPSELITSTSDAVIKNFKPLEGSIHDRFGNRLMTSTNLAYLDGVGEKVQAGILVSLEGQRFIMENDGILRDIERALINSEDEEGVCIFKEPIPLSNDREFKFIKKGNQSNFYVLTVAGKKYAIKTHTHNRFYQDGIPDKHQPYTNEMLQTQSLALDCNDELDKLKIKMSTFLFASGQISCTYYEEEVKNYASLQSNRFVKLRGIMSSYISEKRHIGDPLWVNVELDLPMDENLSTTKESNFKTKEDGTLVWIDPFIYRRPK